MGLPKLARESWGGEILCLCRIMGVADSVHWTTPVPFSLVSLAFSALTAADGRRPQSPGDTCGRRPTLGMMNNRENGTWLRYGLFSYILQSKRSFPSHSTPGGQEDLLEHFLQLSAGDRDFVCALYSHPWIRQHDIVIFSG